MSKSKTTNLTAEYAAELADLIAAAGPFETGAQRKVREARNEERSSNAPGREPAPRLPAAAWELASYAEGAVQKAASRWRAANPLLDLDDLVQVGRDGAAAAALTFAPAKGAYVAYAALEIWGAIKRFAAEMHQHVSVPHDLISAASRASKAQQEAAAAWNRSESLDAPRDDDDASTFAERVERAGGMVPVSEMEFDEAARVRGAVAKLTAVQQKVIGLVITQDMTPMIASEALGISVQRIRLVRDQALAVLGTALADLNLELPVAD